MKREYILIIIILLLSAIFLGGCFGPSNFLGAKIIEEIPENYVNISEDRMRLFPYLKEAIQNPGSYVDTPITYFYEVQGFLKLHNTEYIFYNNTYYEVGLGYRD